MVTAKIAHGMVTAASQDTTWRVRGEIAESSKARLACSWVTMCTSILPESLMVAAPIPSLKKLAHRDRRELPSTS